MMDGEQDRQERRGLWRGIRNAVILELLLGAAVWLLYELSVR